MEQTKYRVVKAYGTTRTGGERVVWNVMDGSFVVDTFSRRYVAKYYADKWNKVKQTENGVIV